MVTMSVIFFFIDSFIMPMVHFPENIEMRKIVGNHFPPGVGWSPSGMILKKISSNLYV